MHSFKTIASATALVCAILPGFSHADIATSASVYMRGQPGSWVSGGLGAREVTWVHGTDGIFFGTTNYSKGASINYNGDSWWSFDFAAPTYDPETNTNDGQFLEVQRYENATRFPFNSPTRPGLSVSGNGRGNNELSGWFNVLDVAYSPEGELLRLAADFRQYDENLTQSGPSLYGSLRFNSAIALNPVPEPSTTILLGLGVAMLGVMRRASRVRWHLGGKVETQA